MPKFNFTRSRCLNCEEPLPESSKSLFCSRCEPSSEPAFDEGTDYLPANMEEDTVAGLVEGEVAYTVPWAVFADPNRRLFIVGTYSVRKEPGGTVHLKIKRRGDTILVDQSSIGDYRWSPKTPSYVGVHEEDYMKVRLVHSL